MAYISNLLTHWAGRGQIPEKQYEILTQDILKQKKLRFGQPELSVLSKYLPSDASCEMVSFADIPFSECESHCNKYSKFGISFNKAYLTSLYATPVWYFQNPAFVGNLYYIVGTSKKLDEILFEKTGKHEFDFNDREKGHTIHKNTLPLLKYIFSYAEAYDKELTFPYEGSHLEQEDFFKRTNEKAGYFEREWRIIPSTLANLKLPNIITEQNGHKYLNFEEKHVKYIIIPKKFINQFSEEREAIFSEYDKENIPVVLTYEDLKYM